MNTIKIMKTGITDLATDAVVNAANEGLWAGSGVCGAIFAAAGHGLLQAACSEIGHCDTGSAVITPGFRLKAKYIIHAVGPVWRGGSRNEPQQLYGAYFNALTLAAENGCHSIGFPLISAGIYGYPKDKAWERAIRACKDFFEQNPDYNIDIVFAILDDDIIKLGKETLLEIIPEAKIAEKGDWKTVDMPEKNSLFTLHRSFTDEQMKVLRKGNIPQAMEDKWFLYMEGNTLYAHRSWSGFCIYRITFAQTGDHKVTVNCDPEQYNCSDTEDEINSLNSLINYWCSEPYDYYSEWISETVGALEKPETNKDKLYISGKAYNVIFFHRPDEDYGFLSNWYRSEFETDGIRFTSAEQYIMYRKCMIFGDNDSANAVLATDDPQKQQIIGSKAAGYIDPIWKGMRQGIAMQGLLAKFIQNDELRKQLLDTGEAYLVACSHGDKVWGCGLSPDNDDRFFAEKWIGYNNLGFALMEVRSVLRARYGKEV